MKLAIAPQPFSYWLARKDIRYYFLGKTDPRLEGGDQVQADSLRPRAIQENEPANLPAL